ncbi:MAG: putative metallopeptidase [Ignisphaera sp.]
MLRYIIDRNIYDVLKDIVTTLDDVFSYILIDRVVVVRSYGSKTKALARIHALPSIWRYVLGKEAMYAIEVVDENFSKLGRDEQIKVLIHELLHIPFKFSGGLRGHGAYVNSRVVDRLYRIYISRKRINS